MSCDLIYNNIVVSVYRKIPVEGSKITSAVWGPFDEFLVTGHENGAVCRYDVTRVGGYITSL